MTYVAQVGGTHYEASEPGLQHWDIMEDHDVAYLEATATKYLARFEDKGTPGLDLRKARSYLEKVLAGGRGVRRTVPEHKLDLFCAANKVSAEVRVILHLILFNGSQPHLREAVTQITNLLEARGL